MSGLVDIWTSELSKLKEKVQTLYSDGSNPIHHHSVSTPHEEKEKTSSTRTGLAVALAQLMQFNKPRLLCSEASISMLVECFNP